MRKSTSGPEVRVVALQADEFVAVLPTDHPSADAQGEFGLAGLAGDPWVRIPREIAPGYHDEVVAACRRAGFSPDARHRANSIATQLAMVSSGMGVAIAPALTTLDRGDLVIRRLRQPPAIVLSLLVHADADPLAGHFVSTAVEWASRPGLILDGCGGE